MVRNLDASVFARKRLRFRARLADCWLTATVTAAQQRIGDVLNAESNATSTFLAEDLQIAWDGQDEEIRAEFGAVNLNVARVIVPVDEGTTNGARNFEYIRKRPSVIRIGVDGYNIVGDLNLSEGQILRETIARPNPPFIPLTAARVHDQRSGHVEEHRIVFVNRKLATYLVPENGSV